MRTKFFITSALMTAAVLSLSACGGGSDGSSSASSGQQSQQGQDQSGQGQQSRGANGKIAALSGTTMQVQNDTDGQVSVSFSDATTFTAQVAAAASDVQVGSCVFVTPSDATTGDSSSDTSVVEAGSVRITDPVDGECMAGFGGGGRPDGAQGGVQGGGQGNGQGNGQMPNGGTPPSGAPSGGGGQRAGFRLATGKVTAVSAAGFTVESSFPSQGSQGDSGDAQPTTQSVSVTTSATTTYTKTATADASALAVGKCVTAVGDHDDTGAVTATSIQVSDAVDGACSSGFGRFGQAGSQPDGQAAQS